MKILSTILLLSFATSSVFALNPIVVKGSKLFDSVTKEQFFIKGVAYQPRGNSKDGIPDPLADPKSCARDATLMAKLGTNMIRVYETDVENNHDECMKIFENAGIYLLLDIATSHFSINRKTPEYDVHLYKSYKSSVDAFSNYTNVFGFIAGNEVTNDKTNTQASAFVKAALRDIKAYIKKTKPREIPVGYASNDDSDIRDDIKDYFNCGDAESQVDFYGLNLYEWCGTSTFEKSGFKDRTKELEDYSKPVFLSEYGCNIVSPRDFSEVAAIYGPSMTGVWSGGVVYEWSQEDNSYGLVQISGTGEAKPLVDYHNLKKQMDAISPKGVKMDAYTTVKKAAACPSIKQNWKASSKLPPTPSLGSCQCMVQNLNCISADSVMDVPDLTGNSTIGSQIDIMCGFVSCSEITTNAEKGQYGSYSFCSPKDKLSWTYNLKYRDLIKVSPSEACDNNGFGKEITPRRSDLDTCALIDPDADVADETNSPGTVPTNDPTGAEVTSGAYNAHHRESLGNAFVALFVCGLSAIFI